MNRNLDGTLLTTDDLMKIAIDGGVDSDKIAGLRASSHNRNMFRSDLIDMTRDIRLALMHAGKLKLDTRLDR